MEHKSQESHELQACRLDMNVFETAELQRCDSSLRDGCVLPSSELTDAGRAYGPRRNTAALR
jgi:hypothetical protein